MGHHLIFTHGGWIAAQLRHLGIEEMPNNCSCLGVSVVGDRKTLELDWFWEYPSLAEDI